MASNFFQLIFPLFALHACNFLKKYNCVKFPKLITYKVIEKEKLRKARERRIKSVTGKGTACNFYD